MSNQSNFESKIREKLESNTVPYRDAYWNAYQEKYPLPWYKRLSINWKYLAFFAYGLAAFLLGILWNSSPEKTVPPLQSVSRIDTLVIVKEITHRDTLYMQQAGNSSNFPQKQIAQNASGLDVNASRFSTINAEGTREPSAQTLKSNIAQNGVVQSLSKQNPSQLQGTAKMAPHAIQDSTFNTENQQLRSKIHPNNGAGETELARSQKDSSTNKTVESIADNPPIVHKNTFADSLIEEDPEIQKINRKGSPFEHSLGLMAMGITAFENDLFSYHGGYSGGIEWALKRNKWQVSFGLTFGGNVTEVDNLGSITSDMQAEFKAYNTFSTTPDDMHINTLQIMSPLSLSYNWFEWKRFRVATHIGAMAVLPTERTFLYDFGHDKQIRVREFLNPFKEVSVLPFAGIQFHYSPSYHWNISASASANYDPNKIPLQDASYISPVFFQLGISRNF